MRYPFWKKCACCWTLPETISVWSLKKCGVSKCLRLNGWNNIMVLKHPGPYRSSPYVLARMCICLCVSNTPPTCSNLRRPEKSRGGLGICIPKSQTWGSNALAAGSAGLLMSHAGESWNNTHQGSAWRERMLERSSSDPHPEKIHNVQRDELERVYIYKGLHFRRTVYGLLSSWFIFYAHTCGKLHTHPQRCACTYIEMYTWAPSLCVTITIRLANDSFTVNSSLFPPDVPQCLPFYWKATVASPCCPPSEWVMANGEQGLRSDGQFEWATESDAIRITTYFPGWSIGYLPIIEKNPKTKHANTRV